MQFLDQAKIYIKAGNGGDGCISFRREKFVEFGGPNGGNGGNGGNVYIAANPSLNTLIDFRYKQHFKALKGVNGKGYNKFGAKANDMVIQVPLGTLIWNSDKTLLLYSIDNPSDKVLIAKGGIGGRGNNSFKSSTNQAPKIAEKGTLGEELWIWLELQLLADVGLIGLPNAGKSTLLSVLSNAKPKIANYPFSTLKPKLGVAQYKDKSFIIADIPGLIKGSSDGKGLGLRFLSHINKCNLLLHVIDANQNDYFQNFITVNKELEAYNNLINQKTQIIIINKTDSIEEKELKQKLRNLYKNTNKYKILPISSFNKDDIDSLLSLIIGNLKNIPLEHSKNDINKKWSPI